MKDRTEDDRLINEAYYSQQPSNNAGQFTPHSDTKNSNLHDFGGLTGNKTTAPVIYSSDEDEPTKSGSIIMDDEQTINNPSDPMVYIQGYGTITLSGLKKMAQEDLKKILTSAERDNFDAVAHHMLNGDSPVHLKIKAVKDVEKEMSKPSYKRKVTLAKRRM